MDEEKVTAILNWLMQRNAKVTFIDRTFDREMRVTFKDTSKENIYEIVKYTDYMEDNYRCFYNFMEVIMEIRRVDKEFDNIFKPKTGDNIG